MFVLQSEFMFSPSRQAAALISAGAAIGGSAMFIIPISPLLQAAAALCLFAWFARAALSRAFLRGRHAVCGLRFQGDQVVILDSSGNDKDIGTVTNSTVSPWLTTLVIAADQRRYYALVMQDSLPPNSFRHLRIRLNN